MTLLHTSPLLFLRSGGNSSIAGRSLNRRLSLREVEMLQFFSEPHTEESALEAHFDGKLIAGAREGGLIVECDDAGIGSGSTWEHYNLQRAAYCMFSTFDENGDLASGHADDVQRGNLVGHVGLRHSHHRHGHEMEGLWLKGDSINKTLSQHDGRSMHFANQIHPQTHASLSGKALAALLNRRTERFFSDEKVSLATLSKVAEQVDAAIGDNRWLSFRVLVQGVEGLERGVYTYDGEHGFERSVDTYVRKDLLDCVHGQWWLNGGGVCWFFSISLSELAKQRESNPHDYFELIVALGAVGQALVNAAYENGLGCWMTPAVSESLAAKILGLNSSEEEALYFFKVGIPERAPEVREEKRSPI